MSCAFENISVSQSPTEGEKTYDIFELYTCDLC